MILKPDLLLQQSKPLPLVGIKPGNLMKPKQWNVIRQAAYAALQHHCWSCGILMSSERGNPFLHQCHETYNIDWITGVAEISEFTGICWCCHQFIHIDQLVGIAKRREFKRETIRMIIRHGWRILKEHGLPLHREFKSWQHIPWHQWCLIWQGKTYHSDYCDEQEWKEMQHV